MVPGTGFLPKVKNTVKNIIGMSYLNDMILFNFIYCNIYRPQKFDQSLLLT